MIEVTEGRMVAAYHLTINGSEYFRTAPDNWSRKCETTGKHWRMFGSRCLEEAFQVWIVKQNRSVE